MDNFSFKELEQCYIKATYPIEIGNKTVEAGEVIAAFDKIRVAGLNELVNYVSANGGFDNRAHVYWETTKEMHLSFSQGTFSEKQWALLNNSKLFEIKPEGNLTITATELCESDEEGWFRLEHEPIDLFVYDKETGEKYTCGRQGKEIKIKSQYTDVIVNYTYNYSGGAKLIQIGNKLLKGFVSLEGRTRAKDDTTGQVVTGLIKIPKLKVMSGLTVRLGQQATPIEGTFNGVACPVGSRGNSYVSEFYFLNNDLDSDF